jgi:hypothetical protein
MTPVSWLLEKVEIHQYKTVTRVRYYSAQKLRAAMKELFGISNTQGNVAIKRAKQVLER